MKARLTFGSVCSGIEAASVAWHPLGWQAAWLAEIEPFPCAVLAHHYPDVPNLGDMTTIAHRVLTGEVSAPDVFCGGTPCQAFSVAGLRQSLDDARGNLTLKFVEIANAIDHVRAGRGEDECIVFWENVPGVLSTKDNAFGCFLAGLAGEDEPLEPPGGKWANAGCVFGPERAVAWRLFDAQYFGVAQRRRRVFVVASARKGFDPATVLFEWDGVRRDTAPSREAGEAVAGTFKACASSGGWSNSAGHAAAGYMQPVAFGGNNQSGPIDVATARNACASASGRMDFETETFLVQPVHTLRGEGFDASEDGKGRGTPLVPMFLHTNKGRPDGRRSAHTEMVSVKDIVETLTTDGHAQSAVAVPVAYGIRTANTSSNGWGIQEECTHTLDCAQGVAVAFSAKDYGGDAGSIAPTLRAMGHGDSHANGGGQVAVAFAIQAGALRTNPASGPDGVGVQADHAYTLEARAEVQAVQSAMQVRRLTPTECEKLQGFEPGYTAIPWRKKPASECPDGPRYRALGNSWAIPVVRWIGRRIDDAVHAVARGKAA